ncbi:MAG: NAD(P)/FAD-dependent oxidoreductase [Pseudomonadota bacterium]
MNIPGTALRRRVAIVGSGISGLTAAHLLCRRHDVTVYEADTRIGGHTHTVDVTVQGRAYAIDTGFIVCNDRTYPDFLRLLDRLGVARQPSTMGFSVQCERSGLEWAGGSLDQVFAQRRNLLNPRFWGMLTDILRFNREARDLLDDDGGYDGTLTLGEYLERHDYSPMFRDYYIVAMGAAIWSAGVRDMLQFPVRFFVRFFHNHGLLNLRDRPQWQVLAGGSRSYLGPLTAGFADRIRTASPVLAVHRSHAGVEVRTAAGPESFDAVVFACHSDQALQILGADATPAEREILGAIPYQENEVVLHTDTRLLPVSRKTWSSWNYRLPAVAGDRVQLTYNMNILQSIRAPETFCVTLNRSQQIDAGRILGRWTYHHPCYTTDGMRARARREEISGAPVNGGGLTYYCGAYWHNGFHEDGVSSALAVAAQFGERL